VELSSATIIKLLVTTAITVAVSIVVLTTANLIAIMDDAGKWAVITRRSQQLRYEQLSRL
jgi:hypothetical protein